MLKLIVKNSIIGILVWSFCSSCNKKKEEEVTPQPYEAEWTEVSGLYGGHFTVIRAVGTKIYAVGADSHLYISSDNGTSWSKSVGISFYSNDFISSGGILFVGMSSTSSNGATLLVSGDEGNHWNIANNGIPTNLSVYKFLKVNSTLYATTSGGIFKSTDNGAHWNDISSNLSGSSISSIVKNGNSILVLKSIVGAYEIYASDNEGLSWVSKYYTSTPLVTLENNGSKIYCGTINGMLFSTNNGDSWSSAGLNGKRIKALKYTSNGLFAATENGSLHRTLNDGIFWSQITIGIIPDQFNCLESNGTHLFVGAGTFGMYISDDSGQNWNIAKTRMTLNDVACSGNTIIVAPYVGGAYLSIDAGLSWANFSNGLSGSIFDLTIENGTIYGANNGGLRAMNVNGGTWTMKYSTASLLSVFAKGDKIIAGSNSSGVIVSLNRGSSWIQTSGIPSGIAVNSVYIDDSVMIAGTSGGGIYRSIDNGSTWSYVNDINLNYAWSFAKHNSKIFAATHLGVFVSSNFGESWTSANGDLQIYWPYKSLVSTGPTLFVSNQLYGVYYTNDNGAYWNIAHNNAGYLSWAYLATGNQHIYAASHSDGGLWKRPI